MEMEPLKGKRASAGGANLKTLRKNFAPFESRSSSTFFQQLRSYRQCSTISAKQLVVRRHACWDVCIIVREGESRAWYKAPTKQGRETDQFNCLGINPERLNHALGRRSRWRCFARRTAHGRKAVACPRTPLKNFFDPAPSGLFPSLNRCPFQICQSSAMASPPNLLCCVKIYSFEVRGEDIGLWPVGRISEKKKVKGDRKQTIAGGMGEEEGRTRKEKVVSVTRRHLRSQPRFPCRDPVQQCHDAQISIFD